MNMGLIICAVIALVIAVILLLPIDSSAELWYVENEGGGEFSLKIAGIRLRLPSKKKKEEEKKETAQKNGDEETGERGFPGMAAIKGYWDGLKTPIGDLWRFILRRGVQIRNVELELDYGLDDPMDTGMMNGLLYTAVYSGLALMHRHMTVSDWNIRITPDFDNKKVNVRFLCILRTRIVHIINIGARAFMIILKYRKLSEKG